MKNKKQAQYSNHSVLSKRSTECSTPKKHSYPDDTVAKRLLSKKQKRQRQENSLDELTRAFIDYVKEQKQTNISINEVVKKLKVKKRRIYDITNVLEGIVKFIIYTRHRLHKKTGEKPSDLATHRFVYQRRGRE